MINPSIVLTFWSQKVELYAVGWLVGFLVLLGVVSALSQINWRQALRTEPAILVRGGLIFGLTVIGLAALSSSTYLVTLLAK